MSNLSRESWATWVEDNLGFPFWCKIAAICVNIGFIVCAILDILEINF